MTGTFVNTLAVIVGSSLGLLLKKQIPEKVRIAMLQALGLSTLLIGIKMGFEGKELLAVILSLVIGGAIGTWCELEYKIEGIGRFFERKLKREDIVKGWLTATIIFCVGPMTVLGCFQDGLMGKPEILFLKSLLDFVTSIMLASTLGFGVLLSTLSVLVIQGTLTIFASQLFFLKEEFILGNFTATGGIMILAIGFRLLDIKDIKVGDFLPALIVSPLISFLWK
ncbi:MAG: DUF554 domain-containing protein [Synergistetes bacterium]|nr:DUF554 domain-containing protein [Synergistota bacterium]MCX8127918.1 DUF554 domain-containing protein [Synergistota bacterium]MDW8192180.1 DUF554 domain-containing protein [Synergistota bacterium]